MSLTNPFQQALDEYFGGSTGGELGPGVSVSSLLGTKAERWYVNYTPGSGNECDIGFEHRADPAAQLAYIDVHTTPGYFNNNFDYRMIYGGGATGIEGQGGMVCQGAGATFYHPLRTNPPGAALPPPWYIDYGETVVADGLNQLTTITFNTTFATAPKVIVQVVDTGPGVQVDNFTTYIEATTTGTCSVRGYGSVSTGFLYNWIAIGGI